MVSEKEVKAQLEDITRKIQVMEWDKSKNQLNPGRFPILNGLKEEQAKIEQQLQSFSTGEVAPEITNELKEED